MRLVAAVALFLAAVSPAFAQSDPALIEEGRILFFEETFGGNGRTCGTCHPATNNFTIDPAFVRRLSGNDPLFAVRGPGLGDLEMRQFLQRAIILENLDGFGNPGVMRGVPHTLALNTSTANGLTGWSGDGSPGTLRDFATGAVRQHFTKTLNRIEGVDFRLPTPPELDALEAFQRSLGRQQDIDLAALPPFADPAVEEGRALFTGAAVARDGSNRACSGCHTNGGTNDGQRATGVNDLPQAPACLLGFKAPGDGGMGLAETILDRRALCGKSNGAVVFRGDQTFNVPPAIEAADTAPFFHNNAVPKLEGAVAFYTTDTFNNSIAGAGRAFVLNQNQINAIAAFLRALNAMENIRSSAAFSRRALDPAELAPAAELVKWAEAETTDAIEVLTQGPIKLFPEAVALLRQARDDERDALAADPPIGALLEDAVSRQELARDEIISP
jgi:cytochrome c peroxidase